MARPQHRPLMIVRDGTGCPEQRDMFKSGSGLGRVKTVSNGVRRGSQEAQASQAPIAAISGLIPTIFMTRVRL